MNNKEFIRLHREDDIRSLALKKVPEGVDTMWCLQQIEGWQLARKKLPRWAEIEDVWFPPKLSMEQCSSELTAEYKQQLIERLLPHPDERTTFSDFTGGFGIDFSYMARSFRKATYIERMPHLCDIAHHNFPLLGLANAEIVCADSNKETEAEPTILREHFSVIFLDPARRDNIGRKVSALEDCTPNVIGMQDALLTHASYIILKLSPMLDITQALRQLKRVIEVHVVSVQGECKEVLLVQKGIDNTDVFPSLHYHCVNLNSNDRTISIDENDKNCAPRLYTGTRESLIGMYLYEPNASILKAGVQDSLCQYYAAQSKKNDTQSLQQDAVQDHQQDTAQNLQQDVVQNQSCIIEKLHPISNLYVSCDAIQGFPGRQFRIVEVGDFSKRSIKALLQDVKQANLTIRNFPATVQELRKKLKLKEGGQDYLFATTLADGSHVLIQTTKPH